MQTTPEPFTDYENHRIYSISKELIKAEKKRLNKKKLNWAEVHRIYNIAVDKMEDEKLPRCHRCDKYSDEPICSIECKKEFEKQQEEDQIKWKEYLKWWDNLSVDEKYNISPENQIKYKDYLLSP
jgi:hypothetical protein